MDKVPVMYVCICCEFEIAQTYSDLGTSLIIIVIGSVDAIQVLMSFHQSQMTRQVLFLPTEIEPRQRMLKNKRDLQQLQDDSDDIYMSTRFKEYLHCHKHLKHYAFTYS